MAHDYPGTELAFSGWLLRDLRDPVLDGPGSGGVEAAAATYLDLATTLEKAADDLRAVLRAAQGAHHGAAAEASQQHIIQITATGDTGAAQARLAAMALQDQAEFHARARTDMQALAGIDDPAKRLPTVPAVIYERSEEAARVSAIDAAERYQSNTNHNLSATFQAFQPPQATGIDVSPGAAVQNPAWPVTGAVAGAHGVATPAAGAAAGLAPLPPGHGGGHVTGLPGGAGSPGGSTVPAAASGIAAAAYNPTRSGPAGIGGARSEQPAPASVPPAPSASAARGTPPGWTGGMARPQGDPGVPWGGRPAVDDPLRSGWVPGEPWSARVPGLGGDAAAVGRGMPRSAGPDGYLPGSKPPASSGSSVEPPASRSQGLASRPGDTARGGVPFMPGGAGGRGQDTTHPRPPWLLEDDPEAIWLSGLPPHTAPVIGGEPSAAD